MGRKVFVSYKYGDTHVPDLYKVDEIEIFGRTYRTARATRVRDYVDELQEIIGKDNINLGEKDGESLQHFADETIKSALKDKIFNSSVTIVMISKGMKETYKAESDQWIPWEISYSLRQTTRADRTSRMNGVIAVVLPDENNSYDWYITHDSECNCTNYNTSKLFQIIKANMFNEKKPNKRVCNGYYVYSGEFSYILNVKWEDFKVAHKSYIERAVEIRDNKELYDTHINI
ncbi:TIR domain-containing protein [Winogradskyella psychrotolerans]|uniref:TIR domain-containing protein n=1 Tax=Winogradskyella psychrotolerans TaxID=1344585 RepID=UPI001C076CB7|nr:TIR domain-containing protein [Winogradskyella psychrotolerans]MBU2920689.1 TIR domain-containing protein [Winogradskyella psychrotolerans]